MRRGTTFACLLAGIALLAGGCPPKPPTVPITLPQYEQVRAEDPQDFPAPVVVQANIRRVIDPNLPLQDRLASMALVKRLGTRDPEDISTLRGVAADQSAPRALRDQVRDFVSGSSAVVAVAHPAEPAKAVPGAATRNEMLMWLVKHGRREDLAQLVKLWAQQRGGPDETKDALYKTTIKRMTNKEWDQALIEAINADKFYARGSAVQVLAMRVPVDSLHKRIMVTIPQSDAMKAVQLFVGRFDYLPDNGRKLYAAVTARRMGKARLAAAAELSARWRREYGYKFDICDVHLLVQLAGDTKRSRVSRPWLIVELAGELGQVQVPPAIKDSTFSFTDAVGKLSMADLWKVHLLNQMLARPQVRRGLRTLAEWDRNDRTTAWGGLIYLDGGQAKARVYRPAPGGGGNDLLYVAGPDAVKDGVDSLCRFHAHFERVNNAERAGPSREELRGAEEGNYSALVVTSISKDEFCAYYYNGDRVMVSIGKFSHAD